MLLLMAENFGTELSEARQEVLLRELNGHPFADVKRGLTSIMRTRKLSLFPTLGEILEAIGAGEEQGLALQAEQQWLALLESSSYERPPLDAAGAMAYRCMGGEKSSWTNANLDFKRKAFIEGYLKFAKAERSGMLSLENPRNSRLLALAGRAVKQIA